MAFYEKGHIFLCFTFLTFFLRLHAEDLDKQLKAEIKDARAASTQTYTVFIEMFSNCKQSRMPHMQFLVDNVQRFVNYPSKTTVGLATKFTSNRKFFANMITTNAFKEMLAKDGEDIWNNLIKKLKYCDEVVMDKESLKEFYDREVDQSKI